MKGAGTVRLGSIGERARKPAGSLNALLSAIGFERWTIGARLALIVVALALPLNVLGIAVVDRVVHAANEAQRTSLLYAARSVAAGLDAQLDRYIVLAKFLASSPHLLDDDLREFEAEARRAFASVSNSWVVVADPDGRQIRIPARRPDRRFRGGIRSPSRCRSARLKPGRSLFRRYLGGRFLKIGSRP